MEIHFDNLEAILKEELLKATKKIDVVVGWLDFGRFESVFEELSAKKVLIRIIIDDNQRNRNYLSKTKLGIKQQIEIKFQQMLAGTYGAMHHKFCIIDAQTVINGSYNWTYTANTYSFENFTIMRNDHRAVDKFSDEFDLIYQMNLYRLQSIQKLEHCKEDQCGGNLVNLLIYDSTIEKYGDMNANIVKVCTEDQSHYNIIENNVSDPYINAINKEIYYMYDDAYQQFGNEIDYSDKEIEEIKEELDYLAERKYIIHSNKQAALQVNSIIIHGWGIVTSYPMQHKHDDPEYYTKIYWKERFVSVHIQDQYEELFGF